jgi:hypothetical protein
MHKPPGFMVMIGLRPHQLASEQDEDNLDREHDQRDQEDHGGDEDLATEAVVSIVRNLHEGGPSAVRDLRLFIKALQAITDAFMAHDQAGLEDAASEACDVLHNMMSE